MNDLINKYQKIFCLEDAVFSQIEHEDAIVAIVYKVTKANGAESILKICTRAADYACEHYFLNYFADKIPVPSVINVITPEAAGGYGAILMEYLSGNLLQLTDLTQHLAYEVGSLLATIHTNKAAGYGDLTKPQEIVQDSTAYFTTKFNESMEECINHLPPSMLAACRKFYADNISLLKIADGPCIIHRDYRPGNVIIKGNKVQGIIDWSAAKGGFAEEDFTLFENGSWSTNTDLKQAFLAGYASIRSIPHYENVMPLLKLSKAIAAIGYTVKTKTWKNKNTNLYQRQLQFLESFFA